MPAPQTDPRVDAYIDQAAPFAQPVLRHLRALVHDAFPGIAEAIKWNMPHFVLEGRNLAGMAAFKAHCAFVIHGQGRQGNAMGQFDRITALSDLPPPAELVDRLRESAVTPTKPRVGKPPKAPIAMPQPFAAALSAAAGAQAHFDAFTPAQQREYLEWITDAKTDATRDRRIAQATEWIAQGLKRNWKYEKC
ncbi:YdeI/OmpD-associated family protein [Novosphingobium cyanobacteriorum]|uniref:YdeI/OmpD-associated family protein n=1 Tax=Novosphingobium cyanobacteriorum TaxID=3024215 RepID=A0ABT6CMP3_9SPHN|nr:YdeI/OmpD-associated family protein [Novosphingobium cyanobacteriorum]MDF8335071.1 YdeI/OmpD-associated family protein [Novosphingobium cyanobacteriorum]